MDGSQGNSGGPARFLSKIYEMIDDPVTNDIVSWSQNGHSFVVLNPPDFARDLLPKYFKHNNFSSFIRQLNTYGFRKVDPDQWEFANEDFIRGQVHLLKNINRRKPIHSHTGQGNASVKMSDQEREEFEKEIERLKHENGSLQSQMESHKQENQAYEFGMKSLRQRLLNIDQKQRQLNTSLAQLLQKPELGPSVAQQSKLQNRKRRLLVSNFLYDQASNQDTPIITLCDDDSNASALPMINLELVENFDTCVGFWENLFQDVSNLFIEDDFEFGVLQRRSPLIVNEVHASFGDSDVNIQPNFPPQSHSTSSTRRAIHSSPGSSNRAWSPITSSMYTNLESKAKTSEIDVNSSPDNADAEEPKDIQGATSHSASTGTNDVFWQQFLTETPGSSDKPEVQLSETREHHCRSRLVNPNGSLSNVDNFAKQMGLRTPAEKT
ncbi:winged helix/forkhead transcription factor [Lithospermum erythrorhizon]|uniref:Heat stress transcription factor n=1 Tax=Lithospermum erythrorhizon TaxID=34254 RepID=A0AAV3RCB0_LITER